MPMDEDYTPPGTSEISQRQQDTLALQQILVVRRLRRRVAQWRVLQWAGDGVIGIAAPLIFLRWPGVAIPIAITGVVWFLVRGFAAFQRQGFAEAAAILAEKYERHLFAMPPGPLRDALPARVDILKDAGPENTLAARALVSGLSHRYRVTEGTSGARAVAIIQRANTVSVVSPTRGTRYVWPVAVLIWGIFLVTAAAIQDLGTLAVMGGILIPVLLLFYDVIDFLVSARAAARIRDALRSEIDRTATPTGSQLLSWQQQLFELRCAVDTIPSPKGHWISRLRES